MIEAIAFLAVITWFGLVHLHIKTTKMDEKLYNLNNMETKQSNSDPYNRKVEIRVNGRMIYKVSGVLTMQSFQGAEDVEMEYTKDGDTMVVNFKMKLNGRSRKI